MFYWSHLSYLLFLCLHGLHSPAGLYWSLLPGLVFLKELPSNLLGLVETSLSLIPVPHTRDTFRTKSYN